MNDPFCLEQPKKNLLNHQDTKGTKEDKKLRLFFKTSKSKLLLFAVLGALGVLVVQTAVL